MSTVAGWGAGFGGNSNSHTEELFAKPAPTKYDGPIHVEHGLTSTVAEVRGGFWPQLYTVPRSSTAKPAPTKILAMTKIPSRIDAKKTNLESEVSGS